MITLKEYPGKILPGDEYTLKWTVNFSFLDNLDELKLLDATKRKCTDISKVYSNRHFVHINTSYDISSVLNASITSNLKSKSDLYIDISHTIMFINIPTSVERKVLKYKIKSGRLILDNIIDILPCVR